MSAKLKIRETQKPGTENLESSKSGKLKIQEAQNPKTPKPQNPASLNKLIL